MAFFSLSNFSWHFNFTTFSLRVLCCYSFGCVPKLLLGSYTCHIFQIVEKICEVIWRAVRRMTCGSCFKEMVKLCFFVHFGKGYGGPAKRWLYMTQQKQCLMCTIRFIRWVVKTTAQYSNKANNKEKAQTRWWYGWKQGYNICLLKHIKSLPEDSVSTVFSNTFNSFHIWELIGYLIEKWSMFQYRMSSTGTGVQSSMYSHDERTLRPKLCTLRKSKFNKPNPHHWRILSCRLPMLVFHSYYCQQNLLIVSWQLITVHTLPLNILELSNARIASFEFRIGT